MITKKEWATMQVHILCVVAFLALPYLFTPPHPPEIGNRLQDYLILKKIGTNVLLMVLFYCNYYFLIPTYFFTQKYVLFTVSQLIPGLIITFLFESIFAPSAKFGPIPLLLRVETNFVLFCATVFVSLALTINHRLRESEKQKLNAELSLLKAQINPHFLFNTLNSIYALAVKKSEFTASAIVKLSGMMRYVITEAQTEYVPLEKEITYLNNYIELQKIRLGTTANIDLEQHIAPNALIIAPLLLIPFVENACKYGVNPEEDSPITIKLLLHESELTLTTRNKNFHRTLHGSEASSGLGIANAKQRLEMMYSGCHHLRIEATSNEFHLHLTISLQ